MVCVRLRSGATAGAALEAVVRQYALVLIVPDDRSPQEPLAPVESIYAHRQRYGWLRERLEPGDQTIEFGCGTGRLITMPLRAAGYDVTGIDLDQASVELGQRLLAEHGLPAECLMVTDLRDVPPGLDAVIASEVLEHLDDDTLSEVMSLFRAKLRPGGKLLITVPGGYSEFELENFLWDRAGAGRMYTSLSRGRFAASLRRWKRGHTDGWAPEDQPMTIADSPHLQRFTWRKIHRLVTQAGFTIQESRGAMLICGPFSDILFSGMPRVMAWNAELGRRAGPLASDYYVMARAPHE